MDRANRVGTRYAWAPRSPDLVYLLESRNGCSASTTVRYHASPRLSESRRENKPARPHLARYEHRFGLRWRPVIATEAFSS